MSTGLQLSQLIAASIALASMTVLVWHSASLVRMKLMPRTLEQNWSLLLWALCAWTWTHSCVHWATKTEARLKKKLMLGRGRSKWKESNMAHTGTNIVILLFKPGPVIFPLNYKWLHPNRHRFSYTSNTNTSSVSTSSFPVTVWKYLPKFFIHTKLLLRTSIWKMFGQS